ncbi:hypothetical protein [Pseudomonas entomophila]|nr:hypothetical protein [Pseudomonas entomophila]
MAKAYDKARIAGEECELEYASLSPKNND